MLKTGSFSSRPRTLQLIAIACMIYGGILVGLHTPRYVFPLPQDIVKVLYVFNIVTPILAFLCICKSAKSEREFLTLIAVYAFGLVAIALATQFMVLRGF